MEFYLDTANLEEIKLLNDILWIDGVTTNPTLIAKEKRSMIDTLDEIIKTIGNHKIVHAQIVSRDYEGILEEAKFLSTKYKNIYVKIPVTSEGLKAIKQLAEDGIKTTATAIFTVHQALLASKAGASYVAPYVNRLDNICGNGVETVKDIVSIFRAYGFKTKVLAASFKNSQQVLDTIKVGADGITVSDDVVKYMMEHPLTNFSVDNFIQDWENEFGIGSKVMP